MIEKRGENTPHFPNHVTALSLTLYYALKYYFILALNANKTK